MMKKSARKKWRRRRRRKNKKKGKCKITHRWSWAREHLVE